MVIDRTHGDLTPFDILDVPPNSDWEAIHKSYRSKHTGSYAEEGGNEALNKQLQWAMSQLKDPYLRQMWVAEAGGDPAEVLRLQLLGVLVKTIRDGERLIGMADKLLDSRKLESEVVDELADIRARIQGCRQTLEFQIGQNRNYKNRNEINSAKEILGKLDDLDDQLREFDVSVMTRAFERVEKEVEDFKRDKLVYRVWECENQAEFDHLKLQYFVRSEAIQKELDWFRDRIINNSLPFGLHLAQVKLWNKYISEAIQNISNATLEGTREDFWIQESSYAKKDSSTTYIDVKSVQRDFKDGLEGYCLSCIPQITKGHFICPPGIALSVHTFGYAYTWAGVTGMTLNPNDIVIDKNKDLIDFNDHFPNLRTIIFKFDSGLEQRVDTDMLDSKPFRRVFVRPSGVYVTMESGEFAVVTEFGVDLHIGDEAAAEPHNIAIYEPLYEYLNTAFGKTHKAKSRQEVLAEGRRTQLLLGLDKALDAWENVFKSAESLLDRGSFENEVDGEVRECFDVMVRCTGELKNQIWLNRHYKNRDKIDEAKKLLKKLDMTKQSYVNFDANVIGRAWNALESEITQHNLSGRAMKEYIWTYKSEEHFQKAKNEHVAKCNELSARRERFAKKAREIDFGVKHFTDAKVEALLFYDDSLDKLRREFWIEKCSYLVHHKENSAYLNVNNPVIREFFNKRDFEDKCLATIPVHMRGHFICPPDIRHISFDAFNNQALLHGITFTSEQIKNSNLVFKDCLNLRYLGFICHDGTQQCVDLSKFSIAPDADPRTVPFLNRVKYHDGEIYVIGMRGEFAVVNKSGVYMYDFDTLRSMGVTSALDPSVMQDKQHIHMRAMKGWGGCHDVR